MKKILVIGSAVVDVIIHLEDHLPRTSEDVHAISQEMRMGGCAYNVSDMVRHFQVPYIPFFPIGTGAYGDFVRSKFSQKQIPVLIPQPQMDNGCCYCFIEKGGERTFVSYHGAEYRFLTEWFSLLNLQEIDSVYICGLEIEEPTGINIVSFLEQCPSIPIYFAPGPRLGRIDPALMERLFALHPILHLNDEEAEAFTGEADFRSAGRKLQERTGAPVLVTLGKDGCYYDDGETRAVIPAFATTQRDTIGAGDSHIGAVMSARYLGKSWPEAIRIANRVSAQVVSVDGGLLSDAQFADLGLSI